MHLVVVLKINAVVELGKLQDDFDSLGLIVAREAAVGAPVEDSFAAFVDKVWADGVDLVE